MVASNFVARIAIQKPTFPFEISVKSESSFNAVCPQTRSTSASNKPGPGEASTLSQQPSANRRNISRKNRRILHSASNLFGYVVVSSEHGIDPVRHVFRSDRPVADL